MIGRWIESPARVRSALFLVVALAILLRLIWVATLPPAVTWEDEREFAEVARHLAAGDGYVSDSYRANPALPALLALVFRLFGESFLAARVVQCLLGGAACWMLFAIASRLAGPLAGLLAAAWLAVYPPHIYLAGVFYAEALTTFFLVAAVLASMRALDERGRPATALVAGICLGMTTLTRPVFLACLPAIAAAWLLTRRITRARRAALCLVLLLGWAAVVLPWTMRNHAVYGRVILVSSGLYTKLWQGNNELADGGPNDRELYWGTPDWQSRLDRLDAAPRREVEERYARIDADYRRRRAELGDRYLASDEVLKEVALRQMIEHPWRLLGLMGRKTLTLYSAFSDTLSSNEHTTTFFRVVAALSFYPLLLFAVLGLWRGARIGPAIAPLYAVLAFETAAFSLLNTCTRFRLPLDPFLIVFAAIAVIDCATSLLKRNAPPHSDAPQRRDLR